MSVKTLVVAVVVAAVSLRVPAACEGCSPDGRSQLSRGRAARTLVVRDGSGATRVFAPLEEDGATAFLRCGWRGTGVVWAEAHVSPYNSVYYEWDVATGRILRHVPESRLDVSGDGRHVAWVDAVPLRPAPDADPPALSIDGVDVAVPRGTVKGVVWSPSAEELAVAVEHNNAATIVVYAAATRGVARTFSVPNVDSVQGLRWIGRAISLRSARGEQLFE
jgi:hypothetical protein